MNDRIEFQDRIFLNIATEIAKFSKCISKHVGALIIMDGRILSTGYNGTPPGYENCRDHFHNKWSPDHREWSKKYEIHAEINSLAFATRKGTREIEGSTCYCTHQPCWECSKSLVVSGVKRIVYQESYDGIEDPDELNQYLKDNQIEIVQYVKKD